MTTGIINRTGHSLNGQTVTLGGRSRVFPPKREPLVVQDVRDSENRWHRVEASWILE